MPNAERVRTGLRLAVLPAAVALCALCCASCGPRMRLQPSIQPYEQQMTPMAAGAVPTRGRVETLTSLQTAATPNPLSATPENLRRGEIYYGYYCRMCHGERGDGNGIVGEGYVPKPPDFASARVTGMSDGELYNAMLTGAGHSPVMISTVPPDQRWPIVLHVRTYAGR